MDMEKLIAVSGLYIGLGALAFNYTFPLKITEPPYNWSEVMSPTLIASMVLTY